MDTPRRRRRGKRHDAGEAGCLAGRGPRSCDLSMVLKAPCSQLRAPCRVRQPSRSLSLAPASCLRVPANPRPRLFR